ncbi:hypothetical protein QP166_17905 [Sphingomonas sp. LR60]|uniref:hypothetical protein n=1 Tax=Sphingomonas sp. LR60 TaxID=3050233 RepID=UPI002FDF150A
MGMMDSLAGFIDNEGLAEAFAVRSDDLEKTRRPLLDGIVRTREQFAERRTINGGGRWWQAQNGVVAFTVKLGGTPLALSGSATNHIPEARFMAFLDKLEQIVNAGALDDALKTNLAERAKQRSAASRGGRQRAAAIGERHPSIDRKNWENLTWAQRQKVNALYRDGKNPDGTSIAEVGYKPDAPL